MQEKLCRGCKVSLPASREFFHSSGGEMLHSRCKKCINAHNAGLARENRVLRLKAWRKANPDKCKAQKARWQSNNPKARRNSQLKYKYGLDVQAYETLLTAQNGACAVCGVLPTTKPLVVDHCHRTGTVRGLLCGRCNTALGMLSEDSLRCLHLVEYIRGFK